MRTKTLQDGFTLGKKETPRSLIQSAESAIENVSLEVFLATVTPELAQKLLNFNFSNNRVISKNAVTRYAKKMQQGQWKISSPITFSADGYLIDGQHRLNAVLKAETSVPFMMMLGVPEEVAENIDRGRRRSITDVAHVAGLDWVTDKHAATARWMCAVSVDINGKKRFQAPTIETENLIPILTKYQGGIEFALNAVGANRQLSLSTILSVIAKAYYACPQKLQRLKEFGYCLNSRKVYKGTEDNAALMLVNKVTKLKQGRGQSGGANWSLDLHSECIQFTHTSLDLFLKEVNPKKLVAAKTDLFSLPDLTTN